MAYPAIEDCVLKAMGTRFTERGESFKMRHAVKYNGEQCTPEYKDPAMTVTRANNGWKFYCHRCHAGGYIGDEYLSPKDTLKKVGAKGYKQEETQEKNEDFRLPLDFTLMSTHTMTPSVPPVAYNTLHSYGLSSSQLFRYNIGWSAHYERIIVPIYTDGDPLKPLIAWMGRDPKFRSKTERAATNCPKALTIRDKNYSGRVFFRVNAEMARNPDNNLVVIVEDCFSAIRVHESVGCNTVALLNASVSDELVSECRGKQVVIWLDADKKKESMKKVARFNSFGIKCRGISTTADPKDTPNIDIYNTIKRDGGTK